MAHVTKQKGSDLWGICLQETQTMQRGKEEGREREREKFGGTKNEEEKQNRVRQVVVSW